MSSPAFSRLLGSAALGVVAAVVGTGVHRLAAPLGLLLAYAMVLSAAVLARAWAQAWGLGVTGLALIVTLLVMGTAGPGGDVLITAEALGYAWYVGVLLVAVAAVLPRRWFSDRPVGTRAPGGVGERP